MALPTKHVSKASGNPAPAPCTPLRRRWRLLFACAALLLGGIIAYLLLAAGGSIYYGASYPEALKAVAKQFYLASVATLVKVYDPTPPHVAVCYPDAPSPPNGFRRIELVLPDKIDGRKLRLLDIKNSHIVHSRFDFGYQPYDEPKLQEFRRKYKLDEVVAGCKTELEEQVKLREWCRSQFRRQDYQPIMDNFDALYIMEHPRRIEEVRHQNENEYDPCHFFPLFYAQVLVTMGHNSRVVTCGHGEVGVWSNQFAKWIVMDVELNHHYELEGIPLSSLELHSANYSGIAHRIKIVRGTQTSESNTTMLHLKVPEIDVRFAVNYHRYDLCLVERRNDWWTNHYFRGHPKRGEWNTLIFYDPETPRPLKPQDLAEWLRPRTNRRMDYEWTLNQAEIFASPELSGQTLDLWFDTLTPNFSHFEVQLDGSSVHTHKSSRFAWPLHAGRNELSVRPVNQFGRSGIQGRVVLEWDGPASDPCPLSVN